MRISDLGHQHLGQRALFIRDSTTGSIRHKGILARISLGVDGYKLMFHSGVVIEGMYDDDATVLVTP